MTTGERTNNGAAARTIGACAALLLAVLGGCMGQSGANAEHTSRAKERMLEIKAATEWQTANQAFLSGDLDKALKSVDRSIAINGNVCKSHLLRGRVLMEKGEIDGALKSLAKAQALDPNNADAPYYLGIAFERIQQTDNALANYRAAADLDPANPQYAIATAEMLVDLKRLDEATGYLNSRGATFEHNAGVKQTLGHIAMMKGDAAGSVALFNDAHLLAPDDAAITEDLIRAQIANSQFGDAEYNLARLTHDDTELKRRDLVHLRARCLVEVQRTMEARELLLKLVKGDAGQADVEAWIELANVAYELNDPIRVRQAASRVVALAPKRVEGHLLQGLQFQRDGRFDDARKAFIRAVEVEPTARTLIMLGMVDQKLGLTDEARRCFAKATELDPTNQAARTLLAEVKTE